MSNCMNGGGENWGWCGMCGGIIPHVAKMWNVILEAAVIPGLTRNGCVYTFRIKCGM